MADAHAQMLDLAVRLAEKQASGIALTRAERIIADVTWIDTQVSMNGFYGWLLNTPGDRMERTIKALEDVDCPPVLEMVTSAIRIARVEPSMPAEAIAAGFDRITEKQLEWLMQLDGQFYEGVAECMEKCKRFAEREGIA